MGFCRRCGDIVVGQRCKCGGTAVAPAVQWNQGGIKDDATDRWSKTYVTKDKSPPSSAQPAPAAVASVSSSNTGSKNFARPKFGANPSLNSRVSVHIATTTSTRPSSPLKRSSALEDSPSSSAAAAGILQCPNTGELSKAYGSVLQPKESLSNFACHICSVPFPHDATIYPDPSSPAPTSGAGTRFLCRSCFTTNGGSKGDCPSCDKPVLILKSDGGFVENSGRVWHKRCFRCEGCFKNIGEMPMVDLLGRPSCAECFENCLKRPTKESPQRRGHKSDTQAEKNANLGGTLGGKSREGSPALEELEQRLGITRSRESSPSVEERTRKQSIGARSPLGEDFPKSFSPIGSHYSVTNSPFVDRVRSRTNSDLNSSRRDGSPIANAYTESKTSMSEDRDYASSPRYSGSPVSGIQPTVEAIEEMKSRFLRTSISTPPPPFTNNAVPQASSPPSDNEIGIYPTSRRYSSRIPRASGSLRSSLSSSSLRREREKDMEGVVVPSTPDLMSDFSDETTSVRSSGPSTPPSISPPSRREDLFSADREDTVMTTPTPKSKRVPSGISIPPLISPTATCAKCHLPLFNKENGGKFVSVPENPSSTRIPPKTYHTECFRCTVCGGAFQQKTSGQAVFVRAQGGACHVECASQEKTSVRSVPSTSSSSAGASFTASYSTNTRFERPPTTAPASTTAFPRWGSSTACPGCHRTVSPMERGVVPGPNGSRWHAACLVCGGKDAKRRSGRQEEKPGCGKKLDSAAKSDGEGGVWCRECSLLLPTTLRSPESPTRSPLVSTPTGNGGSFWSGRGGRLVPQYTGTTTIARQFTGAGGTDAMLLRQVTGRSPTRQLASSPTKQLGIGGAGAKFPRPKSVIGLRTAKSVDEGRGMFLVRQMTGGGRI